MCSTSNDKAVSTLVRVLMGPERSARFQVPYIKLRACGILVLPQTGTGTVSDTTPPLCVSLQIFAGDIVAKKKPSPDIYNLAKTTMKLDPTR